MTEGEFAPFIEGLIRTQERKRMSDNTRDINLQIRLNEREFDMLNVLCAAYGLKRTDVIRKLIREDWETFQPPKEW